MSYAFALEKGRNAVYGMATSSGSIQERIKNAYTFNLIHLKPEDLPEELRGLLKEIEDRLTTEEAEGDEGSVKATVRSMDTEEAIDIARKIVRLYDDICSEIRDQ